MTNPLVWLALAALFILEPWSLVRDAKVRAEFAQTVRGYARVFEKSLFR